MQASLRWIGAGATLMALAGCMPPQVAARADYQTFCAGCHGAGGKGDGPVADDLARRPADLTTIAARNGGVFPRVAVMSTIDGYTRRDQHGSAMPEMGPLIEEGELVLVDTGDGVMTPTPARLVALAAYLETIQEP